MAAPTERVFNPLPLAVGGARVISAPFQFITSGEDNLRVTVVSSAVGAVVEISGRRIDQDGQVLPMAWSMAPTSDRVPMTRIFTLGVGAVVNLAVIATSGAPVVGQVFVIAQIVRGHTGGVALVGVLLQGYVTTTQGLGWPGSPIISSTDGEPAVRLILGTNPAAGAGVVETCPTGARWELRGVRFQIATSGVAATRYVAMGAGSLAAAPYYVVSPRVIIASELRVYAFAAGLDYQVNDVVGVAHHAMPMGLLMRAGDAFSVGVVNMDGGDQISNIMYQVREWLEVS